MIKVEITEEQRREIEEKAKEENNKRLIEIENQLQAAKLQSHSLTVKIQLK